MLRAGAVVTRRQHVARAVFAHVDASSRSIPALTGGIRPLHTPIFGRPCFKSFSATSCFSTRAAGAGQEELQQGLVVPLMPSGESFSWGTGRRCFSSHTVPRSAETTSSRGKGAGSRGGDGSGNGNDNGNGNENGNGNGNGNRGKHDAHGSSDAASKSAQVHHSHEVERLPKRSSDPASEFKDADLRGRFSVSMQRARQSAKIAREYWKQSSAGPVIGSAVFVVFGLGCVEGYLLSAEVVDWMFVARYAVANILPSCVWAYQEPDVVVRASGGDPAATLAQFGDTAQDAKVIASIQTLRVVRSIIAGYVLLAQLFRILTNTALTGQEYHRRIMNGQEPPLPGVGERFVRVCGRNSDCTELALHRYGPHVVGVYENPELIAPILAHVHSKLGTIPLYWNVPKGMYGNRATWREFVLDEASLIRTSTGRRVLVLEADGTESVEGFGLVHRQDDLSIEDAGKAFRQIERITKKNLAKRGVLIRTLRVYLGDTSVPYTSGGGHTSPMRHWLGLLKQFDVVVDSKAPVLLALLRWIGLASSRISALREMERSFLEGDHSSSHPDEPSNDNSNDTSSELPDGLALEGERQDDGSSAPSAPGPDHTADTDAGAARRKEAARRNRLLTARKKVLAAQRAQDDSRATRGSKRRLVDPLDSALFPDTGHADSPDSRRVPAFQQFAALLFGGQKDTEHYRICLDTNNKEHFDSMSNLLSVYGFTVLDATSVSEEESMFLPRIIYHSDTAETVAVTSALVQAKVVDPVLCCAIVDRMDGVIELEELANDELASLEVICSATLHDNLFHQIRMWTRQGYSAKQIQAELDHSFSKVLHV